MGWGGFGRGVGVFRGSQVQPLAVALVLQLHVQAFLAAADGAVVGHRPVRARQLHQALYQPQRLAQRQAKQAFDAQAKLDASVREGVLATVLATGSGQPLDVGIEPQGQ